MPHGGKRISDKTQQCVCKNCGAFFICTGVGRPAAYCSPECKQEAALERRGVERVCEQCGVIFTTLNYNALFCSKDCRWESMVQETRWRTMHQKECPACGITFETVSRSQIFCSIKCGRKQSAEDARRYNTCQYCGEPFWRRNAYRMKYCGSECQYAALREETLERHKNAVPILPTVYDRVCPECDTEFTTTRQNQLYCSNDCTYSANLRQKREQWAAEYEPKSFVCKECGAEVTTVCGEPRSAFCSDECSERFTRRVYKERRGEHMKRAFRKQVVFKKIYQRDGGVCQICGLPVAFDKTPEQIWAATIDHIIPLSVGGTHEPGNCQLAHRICNSLKSQEDDGFYIDWDEMCKADSERWLPVLEEYERYMKQATP